MKEKGFTLIELLAVIVILSIIMLISIPNVIGVIEKQKRNTYISDARKLITQAKYKKKSKTDIPNPTVNEVYILTMDYLDNGEVRNDPEGIAYDKSMSYVIITIEDSYITYSVQLISAPEGNFRGLPLSKESDLSKDDMILKVGKISDNIYNIEKRGDGTYNCTNLKQGLGKTSAKIFDVGKPVQTCT